MTTPAKVKDKPLSPITELDLMMRPKGEATSDGRDDSVCAWMYEPPTIVIKPKRGCKACRVALRAGKVACWTHFVG